MFCYIYIVKIPVSSCHYLVDLVTSRETALEPNYAKQNENWEVVFEKPYLDSNG